MNYLLILAAMMPSYAEIGSKNSHTLTPAESEYVVAMSTSLTTVVKAYLSFPVADENWHTIVHHSFININQ